MSIPDGLISYGPDANCTLELCPITASVYEYRPSLAASGAFIALFAICGILHTLQSIKWRTWGWGAAMSLGCICEIIGYVGRIMLYEDPFSFNGFLMQICCITFAPVFFCAAIYVTLAEIINHLGPELSRFNPKWFYYVFITCDVISLALQGAGGGMSSSSSGSSQVGVDMALAGLSFQVITLVVFIGLAADYAIRFRRSTTVPKSPMSGEFKIFVAFMSLAILLILIRCAYRIDELSDGYSGPLIHDEGLFIGLEGVMIILATFSLNVAHPGRVFGRSAENIRSGSPKTLASDSEAEKGFRT